MKKRIAVKRKKSKAVKFTRINKIRKTNKAGKTRKTKKVPEINKSKSPVEIFAIQQDIAGLLTMLVQKLSSFETKLDTVLSRVMTQPLEPKSQPTVPTPMPVPERPRPQKLLYAAICAQCGRDCEIPFKPNGTRPVYCRECFAKRRNSANAKPQINPVSVPQPSFAERIKVAEAAVSIKPSPKLQKDKKNKTVAAPKKKTTAKKKVTQRK